MTTLDDVLNAVIPLILAVVGIYLLYRPLKEPLSGLVEWIKKIFAKKEPSEEELELYPPIQYE